MNTDQGRECFYYKKGQFVNKEGKKLWRQELDIERTYRNDKFRKERVYYYLKKGKIVLHERDADGDGKIDIITHIVSDDSFRVEYDTNYDGAMDKFEYYILNKLTLIERDTDFDDKIDEIREYNPETGKMEFVTKGKETVPTP